MAICFETCRVLISPWNEDYNLRWNRSTLVPFEFKTGSTYVKQSIAVVRKR